MVAPKSKSSLHPRTKARKHEFGIVSAAGVVQAPACPDKFSGVKPLASTVRAWDALWQSGVASVIDLHSDMETICRWASLIDERERAFKGFRQQRIVEGSTGQPTLSPYWQVVNACNNELRALEDRIGLSPKARLQLGIVFAEAGRSLDALNRLMEDDDAVEAPDPRLQAIDSTAS